MRVLVFGRDGQVARELALIAWPEPWDVRFLGRGSCDLLEPGAAAAAIAAFVPDIVINAAAYTAVDKAESEEQQAYALNGTAPGEMALAAARIGAALLHISTDYVFDGAGSRPWLETDSCGPISTYGASKLAGELALRRVLERHVILRTSWVFSAHGTNFVRTMLRLGAERDTLGIVGDQIGGPTAAADIAGALASIARGIAEGAARFGTYHYAGAPATSWHGFAEAIFARAAARGLKTPETLRRIATSDYPTPARRPFNSRLDCAAVLCDWGLAQPSWESALDRCLDVLIPPRTLPSQGLSPRSLDSGHP